MPRLATSYHALLRSYVDSQRLCGVSWTAEALYVRLLTAADGQGVYHGDPHEVGCRLACKRLANGTTSADEIADTLDALSDAGLIVRWAYKGETWLVLPGYFAAGRARQTRFPAPPDGILPEDGTKRPPDGTECPPGGTKCPPYQGSGIRERDQGRGVPGRGHTHHHNKALTELQKLSDPGMGLQPWVVPLLEEYLAHRQEESPRDPKTPASRSGWLGLARELEGVGEPVARRALDALKASGWARLRNAVRAECERAEDPRRKEPPAARPSVQPYEPEPEPEPCTDPDELEAAAAKIEGALPAKAAALREQAKELRHG